MIANRRQLTRQNVPEGLMSSGYGKFLKHPKVKSPGSFKIAKNLRGGNIYLYLLLPIARSKVANAEKLLLCALRLLV